jgi:hypothetical protein
MAKGVQRERKRKISSYNVVTFLFDFYTGAAWLAPTGTAEDIYQTG